MTGRSIENLASLPVMKEKTAVTYTELCSELLTSLYLSGQKELFALSIFKSLQILFKLGNSGQCSFLVMWLLDLL